MKLHLLFSAILVFSLNVNAQDFQHFKDSSGNEYFIIPAKETKIIKNTVFTDVFPCHDIDHVIINIALLPVKNGPYYCRMRPVSNLK